MSNEMNLLDYVKTLDLSGQPTVQDVALFLREWNDPNKRKEFMRPCSVKDAHLISVDCQIAIAIFHSAGVLQRSLENVKIQDGYFPARSNLINVIVTCLAKGTAMQQGLYLIPDVKQE